MKKILANLTIFLLLIIAPVSFSTEDIPCFDVPATEHNGNSQKQKTILAILESKEPQDLQKPEYYDPAELNQLSLLTPPEISTPGIVHGRAPPINAPA